VTTRRIRGSTLSVKRGHLVNRQLFDLNYYTSIVSLLFYVDHIVFGIIQVIAEFGYWVA